MDVSHMFWDLVYIVTHRSCDEIKESRLYQAFECASFLNRMFIIDEAKLLNSSYVSRYPKGVCYIYYEACYNFQNIHSLFYGSVEMLSKSHDLDNNPDALDKLERIKSAIVVLEKYEMINDLTSHLSKLKLR
jgi:hypothetical protein